MFLIVNFGIKAVQLEQQYADIVLFSFTNEDPHSVQQVQLLCLWQKPKFILRHITLPPFLFVTNTMLRTCLQQIISFIFRFMDG